MGPMSIAHRPGPRTRPHILAALNKLFPRVSSLTSEAGDDNTTHYTLFIQSEIGVHTIKVALINIEAPLYDDERDALIPIPKWFLTTHTPIDFVVWYFEPEDEFECQPFAGVRAACERFDVEWRILSRKIRKCHLIPGHEERYDFVEDPLRQHKKEWEYLSYIAELPVETLRRAVASEMDLMSYGMSGRPMVNLEPESADTAYSIPVFG